MLIVYYKLLKKRLIIVDLIKITKLYCDDYDKNEHEYHYNNYEHEYDYYEYEHENNHEYTQKHGYEYDHENMIS
jgi:ABC-type Zn2+ transport system substrate-binding protein/surface adhesin